MKSHTNRSVKKQYGSKSKSRSKSRKSNGSNSVSRSIRAFIGMSRFNPASTGQISQNLGKTQDQLASEKLQIRNERILTGASSVNQCNIISGRYSSKHEPSENLKAQKFPL